MCDIKPGEVGEYGVVRVADEILIDLMKSGCGVDYQDAIRDAVIHDIEVVKIPFASPPTLWRMKQTYREKDIPDRTFLRHWLEARGMIPEVRPNDSTQNLSGWLKKTFGQTE